MGNGFAESGDCVGKQCGYNIYEGTVGCSSGTGSCFEASVLSAEETYFHDKTIADATTAIQAILENIPADPNGRKLSFLNTNMGVLLAWVEHGKPVPPGAVTSNHDDATIAVALKLKAIPAAATGKSF